MLLSQKTAASEPPDIMVYKKKKLDYGIKTQDNFEEGEERYRFDISS